MASPRILIIRTSALGDVVQALPVLTALRRDLPRARIGWVVEEAFAPLLAGHPDLDELVVVRTRSWRKRPASPHTWRRIIRLVRDLQEFSAEVVLDLMGNHKGGALAALTLADRRVGLAASCRREPSSAVWISEGVVPEHEHAVDRFLAVAEALGVAGRPVDFAGDKLFRTRLCPTDHPTELGERTVLVHPGAGWGNKIYPPERWGRVARLLTAENGIRVRAVPGPGEEPLARAMAESSGGAAEEIEVLDLASMAALQRGAALVLGGDTGPVHLAHALGTPVLCVMGPTDPARNGPYAAPRGALWRPLPCSFCHKRMQSTKACLLDIPPEEIASRAREILGGVPQPTPC